MIIRSKAYPRAGLVGNPSDGYFGRTISFTFDNFFAEVVLYPSNELELLPGPRDRTVFRGLDELSGSVKRYGYYGGIRLVEASLKRFSDYARAEAIQLEKKNFSLRYFSNIPPHVGMAGSSAIITACFRALMKFYDVEIPKPQLANLVLSVEKQELKISAGLQDRVAQAYQGLVYMDFDRETMERTGQGIYEPIPPETLPPVYIAYRTDLSESSDVFHNDIRGRYDRGEADVVDAMRFWADLTPWPLPATRCSQATAKSWAKFLTQTSTAAVRSIKFTPTIWPWSMPPAPRAPARNSPVPAARSSD